MTSVATSPQSPVVTATSQLLIGAQNITKSYAAGKRQVQILHGISMGVSDGEMVAVMGPSGSGKSTLLYCLAGLELPTTGSASLAGQETSRMSRAALAKLRRTDVGFVFQAYNLVPTLTAWQNVELPYRLAHRTVPAGLIDQTLEMVGLAGMGNQRPTSMSGGEQQRVALARVLAQQPRIVFADEPTGALDTHTGVIVLDELVRIAHGEGRCVLTVTHDPGVAARCDRVLFLRDGRLVTQLTAPTQDQVMATMAELSRAAVAA